MIVVDASALVEVLLRLPAAQGVAQYIFRPGETLHAPHLIDLEIAQVIRRHAAAGVIDADRGHAALTDLAEFPLTRYPHQAFLRRIWQLRANVTAYDGAYLALAEELDAPLVTRDGPLARSSGHRARIELV